MKRQILACAALFAAAVMGQSAAAMSPEDRESYRQMLLLNLPSVPAFDEWVLKSRELPPDFDALPRNNALPDPLTFADGKPVQTAADWKLRRAEILALYQKHVWGMIPPHPKFDHADAAMTQDVQGQGYRSRSGILYVGPGGQGQMHLTLQIPAGTGPFPVVMGPGLTGGFGVSSANTIRAHGYIVASIAANDMSDDSAKMAALYPPNDDGGVGALPRRGWAASAVVDYLETLPEVDAKHIAITGYSRDGKSMIIGAALDERIAAVVAGSPGVGGILPFRLAGERNQAESIQSTTLMFPDWFHPRLRYFAGREDRLPVDGNLLLATIAPRPFFLVGGNNDEVSNNWGDEQSFHSANKVYKLLGAGGEENGKLGMLKVPGYHGANNWEQALTWLDIQFGKSDKKWTNQWAFPWDVEAWKKLTGETVDFSRYPERRGAGLLMGRGQNESFTQVVWEEKAAGVRKQMEWMLGDKTPAANPTLTASPLPANPPDVPAWVIGRSVGAQAISEFGWYADYNTNTATRPVTFNGVKGTLYYPKNAAPNAKLPTVVWLHSYSYPLGYMWVYHREVHPILALVDAGYAVLAYDQCGFGSRMSEAASFYDKTPKWSQMGRMVEDARAAVDMLANDPALNPKGIYLFGYGLGANVALYAAALEPKAAGVVSICGFTPMRTDTADKGTGGIARFAVERPLLPRLGLFIGRETQIPYDYDEMLAAIAPRPVYVVNPLFDRDATFKDVHAALVEVRKVYGLYNADEKLKVDEPWDYNRLAGYAQDRIVLWMRENMK